MSTNMKILAAMFLLLFACQLAFLPNGNATSSPKDRALSFVSDVAGIDLTKYNVTLVSDNAPINVPDNSNQEQIRYKLQNDENTLDFTCHFNMNSLVWFEMSSQSGSPVFIQDPSSDLHREAENVLTRYKNYIGSAQFQDMKDLLAAVPTIEDTTVTLDNLKLIIHVDGLATIFQWKYIYNGAEAPGISLEFYDGFLSSFDDRGDLFKVGNAEVNLTKEQAITMALEQVKNFSYTVGLNASDQIAVSNFTVLKEPLQAQLSMQVRESSTLYPFWRVDLYLDKVYPGAVNSIAVGIWADTEEVRYIQQLSYGGDTPSTTPEPTASPNPSINPSEPSTTASVQPDTDPSPPIAWNTILTLVAVLIIAVIASVGIRRQRRNAQANN